MASTDTPMVPAKGQHGPAIVAVVALTVIGMLFIIVSAFSQDNAPTTVDGHEATYSHWLADN